MNSIELYSWHFSSDHGQLCQVIEVHSLWGETSCKVWVPNLELIIQLSTSKLKPLETYRTSSAEHIAYAASAAKVVDALTNDVLLAPIEANVIALPHQIQALARAMSGDRVRYLLADEVGLGKTIEAGLILRELKLRGRIKRILVIAPKGLATQWVSEMQVHFHEQFRLVRPDDLKTLHQMVDAGKVSDVTSNAWRLFPQIVVPMDSIKPLEKRRGWTQTQVAEFNQKRFGDLISAGWDLIIVDEAHRLGGSTDQVARFKLGKGLSQAAPYLLLLSATPHQGKTDAFRRLISLLDPDEFAELHSVSRERVQPYVIRTEKRHAIDAEGKPLFKPRRTQLAAVSWEERHRQQRILYEAVTEYAREGYNQAIKEKRSYIGFLMILFQRLVVSSTKAIRTTLEKRLEVLALPDEQMTLFPIETEEDWSDMDGQEQMERLLTIQLKALKNERAEVKLLLEAATRCEQAGPDAKAEALLAWIYNLQSEENESDLKALVFTEFVPTQEMLRQFLEERGISVVCLNGSMDMEERKQVQVAFAGAARVLLSTDAGGEGLNLQFCHVIINYDIPWNPMRLEQRIGRVDRIGQSHTVRAINFVFEDSVEHRVREVLEQKLAVIFEEFGIDKTGDVLDSAQAGKIFDDLHVEAIRNPERIVDSVESVVSKIQEQAKDARATAAVLGAVENLDPAEAQRVLSHPFPHWVERMTVNYLRAHGGKAEIQGGYWKLDWPNGEVYSKVVFSGKEAATKPTTRHLTLEDPRVRVLAMQLPVFISGQKIPTVSIAGIAPEIRGFWSLWKIALVTPDHERLRLFPVFLSDEGKAYSQTARHIWDQLLTGEIIVSPKSSISSNSSSREDSETQEIFSRIRSLVEESGKPVYEMLLQEHRSQAALTAREKRMHSKHSEIEIQFHPEITPVLLLRLES